MCVNLNIYCLKSIKFSARFKLNNSASKYQRIKYINRKKNSRILMQTKYKYIQINVVIKQQDFIYKFTMDTTNLKC